MATTTDQPTLEADEDPNAGFDRKATIFMATLAGLGAAFLAWTLISGQWGLGADEKPAPTPTVSNEAQVREQAYKDTEPIVREFIRTSQGSKIPTAGITQDLRAAMAKDAADDKARGITSKGEDQLLSVKPTSYDANALNFGQRVGMDACLTVGMQLIDKSGKNVRVTPDGKPAIPGERISRTYYLIQDGSKWVVHQVQAGGSC